MKEMPKQLNAFELFPNEPWTDERYKICIGRTQTCMLSQPCITPCRIVLEMERKLKDKTGK